MPVSDSQLNQYQQDGYLVVEGLFSEDEVAFYRDHYMRMRDSGTYPGDDAGVDSTSEDPLRRYPRLIHMHRWDEISLNWMLEPRFNDILTGLTGAEPYAVQTMLYFKPPQARGQALHQDNYYLRAQPGTCIAAWMALDACDVENGCLEVVPGSQSDPTLCIVDADTKTSFTDVTVELRPGQHAVPIEMSAGSVLFFNGQLIHGSRPNTSHTRFRRALIGHYIEGDAQEVSKWYHPALRMDGTVIELESSADGEKCGVWNEAQGAFEFVEKRS